MPVTLTEDRIHAGVNYRNSDLATDVAQFIAVVSGEWPDEFAAALAGEPIHTRRWREYDAAVAVANCHWGRLFDLCVLAGQGVRWMFWADSGRVRFSECRVCREVFMYESKRLRKFCSDDCRSVRKTRRQAERRERDRTRRCDCCGQAFESQRSTAKFCSAKCRVHAARQNAKDQAAKEFTQ